MQEREKERKKERKGENVARKAFYQICESRRFSKTKMKKWRWAGS